MESFGSRVKDERVARGWSQAELAKRAGVSQQLIGKIELGAAQDSKYLLQIARALEGISPEWLRLGRGQKYLSGHDADPDWSDILAVRTAAALGDGAVPDEYAETHKLRFRAESLRRKRLRPERLAVVYGRGDSMLPRIRSGDAILFDTGDTAPADGSLFVVSYDGGLMAKRLVNLGGRWFIESLNRDDPKWRKPTPIDDHKGFQIHGRVRWVGSWED